MSKMTRREERARYEYRVWGRHRAVRNTLARIATETWHECVDDWYLVVDDVAWNAKVRDHTLKVKRLVDRSDGFQRWAAERHETAGSAPKPFDELFERLRLDRDRRGKAGDLRALTPRVADTPGVRMVFVSKRRTRHRIDRLRAEVTDLWIGETGDTLHTISIEGDDIDELAALRDLLQLSDEPNVSVNEAIAARLAK